MPDHDTVSGNRAQAERLLETCPFSNVRRTTWIEPDMLWIFEARKFIEAQLSLCHGCESVGRAACPIHFDADEEA